jgi:hypothetical protein
MNKRTTNCFITLILMLSTVLILSSCSKDDSSNNSSGPPVGSSTQSITPQNGGSVDYQSATVTIPPGALNTTTDISVGIPASSPTYTEPANSDQVGSVYEFGPDGTNFNTAVTVTMSYDQAAIGTKDESTLKIYTFTDANLTPDILGNIQVNETTNTVTGTTTHFSYCVLIIASGTGPGPIPEHPTGGNPQGNWTFQSLTVDTTLVGENSRISETGTGDGTLTMTATTFASDLTLMTHIVSEAYYGGAWHVLNQNDVNTHEVISGTYVIENDTLMVTTITASPTNPDYIGDIRTDGFSASSNQLVLYQKAGETEDYNMFLVYMK